MLSKAVPFNPQEALIQLMNREQLFSQEEMEEIASLIPIHYARKGEVLLKEEEIYSKCYFVLKGLVRQYYITDGDEKTTAFFAENESVASFTHYTLQKPSDHYLACVEDSVLVVGEFDVEPIMFKKYPALEKLTRIMMGEDMGKTQDRLTAFVTSSPEKRYLDFLEKRPELFERVPLHQIASYLGITPESLSRIRRRLVKG